MTVRFASWGIILDDIVFPDGRTAMNQLGGGGLYAAVGMRLWSPDVGIIAAVGEDFDPARLEPLGLDASGLVRTPLPTPRAWQLFEEDETRIQIPRVSPEAWQAQLVPRPTPGMIPPALKAAHFSSRGDPVEEEMVAALAAAGVRLSAEPVIDGTTTEDERRVILRLLAHFELFSPGRQDAETLAGPAPLPDLLRRLAEYGPRIVALRLGAAGSLVYERDSDALWRVPAAAARVVDVTGAGNAYCGGFLVGWVETGDLLHAAACAAVSASVVLEQVGPPAIAPALEAMARARLASVWAAVRPFE